MELPLYQVDAFSDKVFGGNPAAVCPLDEWLPDDILQKIAAENNLSETVFFVPKVKNFNIRWFTPTTEVNLCGHATLAASYVIFEKLDFDADTINFTSQSGPLVIKRTEDGFMMDFPAWPFEKTESHEGLNEALGATPVGLYKSQDYIALFDRIEDIKSLTPDMSKL